jgi:hypothetical protein
MTFSSKCLCKTVYFCILHFENASPFMAVMTGHICTAMVGACSPCARVHVRALASQAPFWGPQVKNIYKTTVLENRLLISCTAIGSGAAQM